LGMRISPLSGLAKTSGAFLDQFLAALPVTMNETLGPADCRSAAALGHRDVASRRAAAGQAYR
jgi:hypothetical protein